MEEKYTRQQIKSAIWKELKEADHTGENNDRAYEIIGIVTTGLDSVDAKPVDNLPLPTDYPGSSYQNLFDYLTKEHGLTLLESEMDELINVVHKYHPAGAVWVKASIQPPIGHSSDYHWRFIHNKKPINRNFHIESGRLIQEYGNTKGSYSLEELEWLDEQATPAAAREEDAVEFAEWVSINNYKWYVAGQWTLNGRRAGTTAELYAIFKQQKNS